MNVLVLGLGETSKISLIFYAWGEPAFTPHAEALEELGADAVTLIRVGDGEGGFGAAVMVNSDNGINLGEEILRGIESEYEWGYLPPPVEVRGSTHERLNDAGARWVDERRSCAAAGEQMTIR